MKFSELTNYRIDTNKLFSRKIHLIPVLIFPALIVLLSTGCASVGNGARSDIESSTSAKAADQGELSKVLTTAQEDKWGIQIVGLRSSMAGMMVDFRYKVLDANKAAPLLDLKNKAYMIVAKNGAKLGVPNSVKIGALRQTTHAKKVKAGRDYFILFGNPGAKWVKPGDKVAVVIGDFKAENLTLQ